MLLSDLKQKYLDAGCELLATEYLGQHIPMLYRCKCGNQLSLPWKTFQRKIKHGLGGCDACPKYNQLDFLTIQKRFLEEGCELLSDKYVNSRLLLDYRCKCGNLSKISYSNFNKGKRCKKCANHQSKTYEEIIDILNKKGFELLLPASEYKHHSQFVEYKCKCNRIFKTTIKVLLKKNSCKFCVNNGTFTIDDVKNYLNSFEYICTDNKYLNAKHNMNLLCPRGHKLKMRFGKFRKGSRCFLCRMIDKTYTIGELQQIFKERDCTLLSTIYSVNHKLDYICGCGNFATTFLYSFLRGSTCGCKRHLKGNKSARWKDNKTDDDRIRDRKYYAYHEWRRNVFIRDKYTCQICGKIGGVLAAHHLNSYAAFPSERLVLENGITLCNEKPNGCHRQFHKNYGNKKNTKDQFLDFIRNIKSVIG